MRGVRGELIEEPWFKSVREHHADEFTFGSAIVAVVFNMLVSSVSATGTIGTIVWHVLLASLWLAWGFVLTAVGTKRAHQFLLWAVCGGGVAGGLLGAWTSFAGLAFLHRIDRIAADFGVAPTPTGLLVADVVLSLAAAALFGYLGVLVYSAFRRLATIR